MQAAGGQAKSEELQGARRHADGATGGGCRQETEEAKPRTHLAPPAPRPLTAAAARCLPSAAASDNFQPDLHAAACRSSTAGGRVARVAAAVQAAWPVRCAVEVLGAAMISCTAAGWLVELPRRPKAHLRPAQTCAPPGRRRCACTGLATVNYCITGSGVACRSLWSTKGVIGVLDLARGLSSRSGTIETDPTS